MPPASARRAVRTYDEIHAGRKLVERRREVQAADERNASRAVSAGKPMPAAKLDDHEAELEDHADCLSAAAGAAVRALEAIPDEPMGRGGGQGCRSGRATRWAAE